MSEVPLYALTEETLCHPLLGLGGGAAIGSRQGYLVHDKRTPLGPCRRPVPRVLRGSRGGGLFLMSEVPLYWGRWGVG